jgi:hypothetical protein
MADRAFLEKGECLYNGPKPYPPFPQKKILNSLFHNTSLTLINQAKVRVDLVIFKTILLKK